MKLGEVVVHMGTTTSPSFIKIGIETKNVFLIAHFFEFLNSLILANSLLDDPALYMQFFLLSLTLF